MGYLGMEPIGNEEPVVNNKDTVVGEGRSEKMSITAEPSKTLALGHAHPFMYNLHPCLVTSLCMVP